MLICNGGVAFLYISILLIPNVCYDLIGMFVGTRPLLCLWCPKLVFVGLCNITR
ncbi:hypothetical protein Hanom_Chr15g01352831 [Helianthus anomalus]